MTTVHNSICRFSAVCRHTAGIDDGMNALIGEKNAYDGCRAIRNWGKRRIIGLGALDERVE